MTLRHFLAILRARAWLAVAILLATVSVAVAVAVAMPRKYTATATLIVDANRPDPLAATSYYNNASSSFLSTQMDVMRSERVALDVVDKLPPAVDAALREAWMSATEGRDDRRVWTAQALQKSLDVSLARDSDVVAIRFTAQEPALAAQLANAFAQAYLDVSVALRVDPARQYSTLFESRARTVRGDLEKSQARLAAFQRDNGIVVSDDRLDIENARLGELSSQLTAIQALVAESGSRQAQAQGGSADRMPEVMVNPMLASMNTELLRAESRLQDLNVRLGESHPQVQEARSNIALLRQRMDVETRRVTGGMTVVNSINRQREAELRGSLEAQRTKVLRLKSVRDEGMVLLRDVESAQRAYEGVLARLNQSSLESEATQGQARMLAQATMPLKPSSQRVLFSAALSVAVGLVIALGAVVLLEWLDPRIRTAESCAELLGVKLLGVLPGPGSSGPYKVRRTPLVSARAMPRLASPRSRT